MTEACMRGALVACLLVLAATAAWATPPAHDRTRHASITADLDCSACHTPEGWRGLATGTTGGGFDHDRTGFPLRARHAQTACTQCHVPGVTMTRECRGCHEDDHRGRLGGGCDGCHGSDSWQHTRAIEQHQRTRLPLTGMHALADCVDCHRRTADETFAAVPADCFACHAADYRRGDVHPAHVGTRDGSSPPFDRNCAVCHRTSGWTPAILPIGGLSSALTAQAPPEHALRFPLQHGSHRGAACDDCHARADGRGPLRCVGCHAHDARTLRQQHERTLPPSAGIACLGCHPGGAAR